MKKILVVFLFVSLLVSCGKKEDGIVEIETSYGNMKVKLYDETPLHRDNFIKLVKEGYYEGILFHRVIKDFMIQAGDPDSKNSRPGMRLGSGEIGYTVKPEFNPEFFHKKGVIAAAREGDNVNPERNSSGSHFYIAQGKIYTAEGLDSAVISINEKRYTAIFKNLQKQHEPEIMTLQAAQDYDGIIKMNDELSDEARILFEKEKLVLTDKQKEAYTTIGGIPHLDGAYTVFGEVIEGLDVLDKIAAVQTDGNDRPLEDVVILKIKN